MTIRVKDVTVKIMAGANDSTVSRNRISKRTETFSGSCRFAGSCNLSIGALVWAPTVDEIKNRLARINRLIIDFFL